MLDASHPVQVRFNYNGDAGNCYAVTATVGSHKIDGYLIGAAHPAIAAFEKEIRAQQVAIPVPAPAPAALAAPPAASVSQASAQASPISFAGFRAISVDGWPVDLSRETAPNVFIYFWSARSRTGIKALDGMESIYNSFHNRGVYIVGVGSASSGDELKRIAGENEIGGRQVLDRGFAARYHVDPAKPFMVLDQSRKVIASAATAQGLQSVLQQLTKFRKPRP